jgi:hypothetical protein
MEVAVWDTWVKRKDGRMMNFDIVVPKDFSDTGRIYHFGKEYLQKIGETESQITARECRFCHVAVALPEWQPEIETKGYYIYEIRNCGK